MHLPLVARSRTTRLGALALALATVAGCSSGGSGGGGNAFDADVTTDVPAATQDVDAITWNLPTGEPQTLDPALSALENVSTVDANMCEGLLKFDKDYNTEPALAESIDHPDDLTYVFNLRPGATFWDGEPVTADDVVYSVQRILDPALGSSWAGWATSYGSIVATDAQTVTLTLTAPDPLVQNYFALPAFTVVEKAWTEAAGSAVGTPGTGVMCSGPYRFTSWTPGQNIVLERYADWWGATDAPEIGKVTFTFVTDAAAQVASLRSGETDGSFIIPTSSYDQLAGSGNLLFGTSLSELFLTTLDNSGPMGDPATRAALRSAIDYDGIAQSIYRGTATPLRALVPPTAYGYAQDTYQAAYDALPEPTLDAAAAASQVQEAPEASQPITLAYLSALDEESRVATAIADTANQAGMDIELKPLTAAEFTSVFSSADARQGIDVLLVTGYLDFPEPLQYYQYFSSNSYYNFAGYSNAPYDAVIAQALGTVDDEARAELVIQAQQLLIDDNGVIPIVNQDNSVYYGPDLAGLVPRQNILYTPWLTELGGK